jgi:hypothetical protein
MSWWVAYFVIASAGLIIVLAIFKVGSDADATSPAIQPGDDVEPSELETATAPSDCSSYTSSRLSPDLSVVQAGSTDLGLPVAENGVRENGVRGEPPSPSLSPAPVQDPAFVRNE